MKFQIRFSQFSDVRWTNYNLGNHLDNYVWMINANDVTLGLLLVATITYEKIRTKKSWFVVTPAILVLTVFRDATLWRETMEYLYEHHRSGYAWTTTNENLRPHAIFILWAV